jgi:hypothetical protein
MEMMKLYGVIDLHSNNNVMVLIDEEQSNGWDGQSACIGVGLKPRGLISRGSIPEI